MRLYFYLFFFLVVNIDYAQDNKPFILFNDGMVIYEDARLDSASLIGGWKLSLRNGNIIPVIHIHSFQNSNGMYYRIFGRSIVTQRKSNGKISLYQAVENDLMRETNPQPNPFGVSEYFSKNDGPIISINYDNMYEAVRDNETSKTYLDYYTWLNYLKYSAILTTVGCVTYDLPRYNGYNKTPTASITSGLVTIAIGFASYYFQGYLMEKAVDEYNK